jgi:N-acetylmuramoyl-L-alanine amidase
MAYQVREQDQVVIHSNARGLLSLILLALLVFVSSCGKPKSEEKKRDEAKTDTTAARPVEKRLRLNVIYPVAGQARPNVDSNFIFGSVGVAGASLTINGYPVPVAPSGGWLAFLPMPSDGVYDIRAAIGTEFDSLRHAYAPPALPKPGDPNPAAVTLQKFAIPLNAQVVKGSDTLATGSDVMGASPSVGADRKWFLPKGATMSALARQGSNIQVSFADGVTAWLTDTMLTIDSPANQTITAPRVAGLPSLNSYPGHTDVRITSGFAPFLIEQGDRQVILTLYGLQSPSTVTGGNLPDSMVTGLSWDNTTPGSAKLSILLQQPLWGYKAFYDRDGAVVLRVRRPPVIDPTQPLMGRRIVIDPGHPPAGATGPTGLTEAQANLAISLPLAEKLRAKGATVIMTRTTGQAPRSMTNTAIDLWARTEIAVNNDAEILLSVHNNAFPDGVNPFKNFGTSTYYFHPHSRDLARELQSALLPVTGLPDKLANMRSLAVVRPTWMPAALTESLYMMSPEQEMMLRDPQFIDRLADAHVKGLEAFLLERLRQAQTPRAEN